MINLGDNEINVYYNDEPLNIYCGEELLYPTTVSAWSVSPVSISASESGTTQKIKIEALDNWTISSSESWITFSQNSGSSGRTKINAVIAENAGVQRTATLTLSDTGNTTALTISVSQEATPFVAIPDTIEIPKTGTTGNGVVLRIKSPYAYTCTSNLPAQFTLTGIYNWEAAGLSTAYIQATDNATAAEISGTLTIDNGVDTPMVITIKQNYLPQHLEITYVVNDTTTPTAICTSAATNNNQFVQMRVDKGNWENVSTDYQFSTTGEHLVEYELTDPTVLQYPCFKDISNISSIRTPGTLVQLGNIDYGDTPTSTYGRVFRATEPSGGFTPEIVANAVKCKVYLNDGLKYVGGDMFANRVLDETFHFPYTVEQIGQYAIAATFVKTVYIGDASNGSNWRKTGMCSFENYWFAPRYMGGGTAGVDTIYWYGTTNPTEDGGPWENYNFYGVKRYGTLHCKPGSDYSRIMQHSNFYLGIYDWTAEEDL